MRRDKLYEINRRLSQIEQQLDELTGGHHGTSIEFFDSDLQNQYLKQGRVRDGKVY